MYNKGERIDVGSWLIVGCLHFLSALGRGPAGCSCPSTSIVAKQLDYWGLIDTPGCVETRPQLRQHCWVRSDIDLRRALSKSRGI